MNMAMRDTDFLPFSLEAEQALIGAVMLNADAWYQAADIVEENHFFEPLHQRVWAVISERLSEGKSVEMIPLLAAIGPDAKAQIAPGMTTSQYVARMVSEAVTVMMASDYAKTIRDLWIRRNIMLLAKELQQGAAGGFADEGVEALLDKADQELAAIRFGRSVDGVVSLRDALNASIAQTSKAYEGKSEIGLTTGIAALDEMLGPMMPGDLITILAASGHGKSALAAQILGHNAKPSLDAHSGEKPGLFFSMEMEGAQIARRHIAAETGISTRKQRAGEVLPAEFEQMADAAKRMSAHRIVIDETPRQTTTRLVRKARAIKRRYGINIIVIDHLLEILPESSKWSKVETVENAIREFKRLAKELQVVVICLAQATREGQKRDHWRLRTSDIYGGDAVKQSSDMVLSLAIPSVWLKEREPDQEDINAYNKWSKQALAWQGKAEIGSPKVRDGESGGWRTVLFDGPRTKFSDR